jgi:signal transduction histidine kinase
MESWLENFARAAFHRSADTAHDLKTPLNVAVLNLELLRMRLQKLTETREDAKLLAYAQAIELELRRMGRIFDAFFLLSTPPTSEGDPGPVDIGALAAEAAAAAELSLAAEPVLLPNVHESRIRQALKLFMEGASRLLSTEERQLAVERDASRFRLVMSGTARSHVDYSKIFKFYYGDPDGNPDLSLATARLIAETYGGELDAREERDTVSIYLSFPLGA